MFRSHDCNWLKLLGGVTLLLLGSSAPANSGDRNWPLSDDEAEAHALGVPPLPDGPDQDGDGIADLDEIELDLDPENEADGWLDLDEDGYSEAWEAFIGSDPFDFLDPEAPALEHSPLIPPTPAPPPTLAPATTLFSAPLTSPVPSGSNPLYPGGPIMEYPPDVPSIGAGDFSGVTPTTTHPYYTNPDNNGDGQPDGFKYSRITGPIDGWEAVVGTKIEVWDLAHPKTNVVELEGDASNYGIKHQITGIEQPGTYLLVWDVCGRQTYSPSSPLTPGDSAYSVIIGEPDASGTLDYDISWYTRYGQAKFEPEQNWLTQGVLFTINQQQYKDHKDLGKEIWVYFQPLANDTRGALIDNVRLHAVSVTEWAPSSGFDNEVYPQAMMVPESATNLCRVDFEPGLPTEVRDTLKLGSTSDPIAEVSSPVTLPLGDANLVSIWGNAAGTADIYLQNDDGDMLDGSQLKHMLFKADVKSRRDVHIYLWTVTEDSGSTPTDVPTANDLEDALNNIYWGIQANVYFSVSSHSKVVNYDLNGNGALDKTDEDEEEAIVDNASNGYDHVNIYVVDDIVNIYSSVYTAGYTRAGGGGPIFYQGISMGMRAKRIMAHEIGHYLGIEYVEPYLNPPDDDFYHNSDDDNVMSSSNQEATEIGRLDWNTIDR